MVIFEEWNWLGNKNFCTSKLVKLRRWCGLFYNSRHSRSKQNWNNKFLTFNCYDLIFECSLMQLLSLRPLQTRFYGSNPKQFCFLNCFSFNSSSTHVKQLSGRKLTNLLNRNFDHKIMNRASIYAFLQNVTWRKNWTDWIIFCSTLLIKNYSFVCEIKMQAVFKDSY